MSDPGSSSPGPSGNVLTAKDDLEHETDVSYSRETTGPGSHGSILSGDSKSMDALDELPLAGATRRCMAAFVRLVSCSQAVVDKFRAQLPLHVARNQHDRFRLWAGNLGALSSGRASLDFRLMDSALMQNTVLKLLEDLESSITKSDKAFLNLIVETSKMISNSADLARRQ